MRCGRTNVEICRTADFLRSRADGRCELRSRSIFSNGHTMLVRTRGTEPVLLVRCVVEWRESFRAMHTNNLDVPSDLGAIIMRDEYETPCPCSNCVLEMADDVATRSRVRSLQRCDADVMKG